MNTSPSKKFVLAGLIGACLVMSCGLAQAGLFGRARYRRTQLNSQNYYYYVQPRVQRQAHPIEHGYSMESSPYRDHAAEVPAYIQGSHHPVQHGYSVESSPRRDAGHFGGAVRGGQRNQPQFHQGYSQETSPRR